MAFAALLAAAALGAASNSASSEVAYCWVDAAAAQTQSAAVTNLFAVPADAGPPAPAIVDPSNPNRALDPTNGRTFVRIPCPRAAAMRTSNGYVDDGFAGLAKSGTATSDLGNPATGAFDANRFEVRGGFFAHGVGSVEKNTYDLNLELVTPRVLPWSSAMAIAAYSAFTDRRIAQHGWPHQRDLWRRAVDISDLRWIVF